MNTCSSLCQGLGPATYMDVDQDNFSDDGSIDTPPARSSSRRIFLCRHAESTNNEAERTAYESLTAIWRGELPPRCAWRKIAQAVSSRPLDSPLSEAGREQVERQRLVLNDLSFVDREHVELVVHSHLARARDTARGLFGGIAGLPLVESAELFEQDVSERIGVRRLEARTSGFTSWLAARPERTIVVVGHSMFFDKVRESARVRACVVSARVRERASVRGCVVSARARERRASKTRPRPCFSGVVSRSSSVSGSTTPRSGVPRSKCSSPRRATHRRPRFPLQNLSRAGATWSS